MNKSEEACAGLLKIFGEIPELYEKNRKTIDRCDLETQDLLHEIELAADQDAAGGYRLYKELREVRRSRRRAKNENELLQPFLDVLKQYESFRIKLCKVNDKVKKQEQMISTRRYIAKVRTDLTICEASEGSEVG
jgi:hypothetical protein